MLRDRNLKYEIMSKTPHINIWLQNLFEIEFITIFKINFFRKYMIWIIVIRAEYICRNLNIYLEFKI